METNHLPFRSDDTDGRCPWMGLATFTQETRRYFFGRDAEIADIFVRVREQPLTILYGQSGLGKSSLLGAGLMPKLEVEGWCPVLVRLRYEETDASLIGQLHAAVDEALGVSPDHQAAVTLWERLHHLETRPRDIEAHPPVLIFDQFEEIFTLGLRSTRRGEAAAFFTQLAEVIENRPPTLLREHFEKDRRLAREYDFAPVSMRFVITLREDYLSGLEEWKKTLPSLMRNRTALNLLSGPQALEAVIRPGELDGPAIVDREVGVDIVRFVANEAPGTPLEEISAVPPLLSLVCERLNAVRIERGHSTITAVQVASQSHTILDDFYEESFAVYPPEVRHFVEDVLVTERGHRAPYSRDDAVAILLRKSVVDPSGVIDALLARRLITAEERGGIPWIEITHDVLAPLVVRSRDDRRERERANAERRRAEVIEKERRRLRRLAMVFAVLALLAVAGGGFGWMKAREAATERDQSRHNEGLGWMLRAEVTEERGFRYPDTLLYAAQAIGFDGVGRPEKLGAGDEPLRFLRQDRSPAEYQRARDWIADRPAYLPVWSSGNQPEAPVTGLAVDPSGRWLALGNAEGVRLFDLQVKGQFPLPDVTGVRDLAFSPDGKTLAISTAERVRLWLVDEARYGDSPAGVASALAWSPGGDFLAGAGDGGAILLWKDGAAEPDLIPDPGGGTLSVISLCFSPENAFLAGVMPLAGPRVWFPDLLATASSWTELNVVKANMIEERDRPDFLERVDHGGRATSVVVSPDGMALATGTAELDGDEVVGGVTLWNAAGAEILGKVSPEQRHRGAVTALAYRADGAQLASGSVDGTIKLWTVSGGTLRLVATLTGHLGAVTRLVYSPRDTLLASAGEDGSAKLWDVSGRKVESLDLYAYQTAGWYQFTPEAAWKAGEGFVNPAAETVLADWAKPAETDAVALLVADAKKAAKEKRWRRVALRAEELERLGGVLPTALAEGLAGALPKASATLGDEFTNGEDMSLLWCPPGTFLMGSPEGEMGHIDSETQHTVTLTSGLWLCRTEVTQAQWLTVMGRNPSTNRGAGLKAPVENLSWDEAMEYCRRLTDRERARGMMPTGWEYRLPTEAQWEYACRAGTTTAWSFGDDKSALHRFGNFNDLTGNFKNMDFSQDDKRQYTAPVGSYERNPWGFYDMHGNVLEWCLDWYDIYTSNPKIDPVGTIGSLRVGRGGSFNRAAANCRSADRYADQPAYRGNTLGLRPALVPSSQLIP